MKAKPPFWPSGLMLVSVFGVFLAEFEFAQNISEETWLIILSVFGAAIVVFWLIAVPLIQGAQLSKQNLLRQSVLRGINVKK